MGLDFVHGLHLLRPVRFVDAFAVVVTFIVAAFVVSSLVFVDIVFVFVVAVVPVVLLLFST